MATGPALTQDQNILPVQAYFNVDGSFNTFIGQGVPFVVSATESIGIIDTTVSGTFYPTFSPVNSGQVTSLSVTSTKLSFNPYTGVLTANGGFVGSLNGTASTATNLGGGEANTLVYQSSAGNTAYLTNGTTGQVLVANTSGAPTWSSVSSSVAISDQTTSSSTFYPLFVNATSGSTTTVDTSSTKLQYVPSTGILTSTGFSGAGTGLTGTAASLSIGGNAATATSATSATTATNLAGGLAGYLPYQSAVNTTTFLSPGTNGYILTLAAGLPTWAAVPTTGVTITDDTSSATTYYPLFARITSGTATTEYTSSTKLNYTPSTGLLAATSFSGSGANLTSIPNSALVNSAITINGTSTSLGGSVSVGTVTSVSGTGTVSGISLSGTVTSSGNLTLGGTLDLSSPPAIGGTTPAAGTFTTITGQTEVLKGTGSNLVLQSQALATTPWSATNIGTLTNNAAIAPDGTNTATSVISNTTSGNHYLLQAQSSLTFGVYTLSFYAKANGYTSLSITNSPNQYANFDLTNVVAAAGSGWTNATITSVGSGWYRCTVTSTNNSAWTNFSIWVTSSYAGSGSPATYAGNGTSGVYLWGVQTEEGNIANTYVPTTTTAIYGTPTLSFSGVAGLGLQSDGSLYVSPAGTGALQAQATTSSTVGGNARGANAVDWQTSRTAASQVASGQQSVIGGGLQNTASAAWGTVVGGYSNTASNTYVVAAGGDSNTASGNRSALVGGSANIAGGYLNFIGGGYGNSGTANAAVTTQSATMNGTTAVTLSGSNASIKVGQYITGTSIAFNTYVAAISGTSLTLSQAASGSSTSTLSFYTPHGVVVGGGNNQATGSYSFIGGGGDAGTAANRNVASGDWSFVGGGWKNTSLGNYSVIVGGNNNTNNSATNAYGFIGGGIGNTTSGFASMIVGGQGNLANSIYGSVLGSGYGTTRGITGYTVLPANNGATGAYNTGGAQSALLIVGAQTTTATSQVLTSDNAAAGTTNQVILPNNSAYYFKVSVIANVTGGGNTKAWTLEGAIKRGSGVGTAAIVGTVTTTIVAADVGAATWTVTATADTTNGGLAITFTGQASTTIRVVAQVQTTEVTY
jgi:hypothetical protein